MTNCVKLLVPNTSKYKWLNLLLPCSPMHPSYLRVNEWCRHLTSLSLIAQWLHKLWIKPTSLICGRLAVPFLTYRTEVHRTELAEPEAVSGLQSVPAAVVEKRWTKQHQHLINIKYVNPSGLHVGTWSKHTSDIFWQTNRWDWLMSAWFLWRPPSVWKELQKSGLRIQVQQLPAAAMAGGCCFVGAHWTRMGRRALWTFKQCRVLGTETKWSRYGWSLTA